MGAENRGNGTYYYDKVRVGDRVRSVYRGGGVLVELRIEHAAERREIAAAQRAAWKARQTASEALEQQIAGYARSVERSVVEALEAAGWHRKDRRHQWVRRMGKAKQGEFRMIDIDVSRYELSPEAQACAELAGKAQAGSKPALRRYLEKSSDETRVTLGFGELGDWHQLELAEKFSKGNPLVKHAVLAKMRLLRAELAGESPSPAVWYLADVASQCWADFQRCMIERENLQASCPLAYRAYCDRRCDRSHRRFTRSVKVLAAVQRVPPPTLTAIQINVGSPGNRRDEHAEHSYTAGSPCPGPPEPRSNANAR